MFQPWEDNLTYMWLDTLLISTLAYKASYLSLTWNKSMYHQPTRFDLLSSSFPSSRPHQFPSSRPHQFHISRPHRGRLSKFIPHHIHIYTPHHSLNSLPTYHLPSKLTQAGRPFTLSLPHPISPFANPLSFRLTYGTGLLLTPSPFTYRDRTRFIELNSPFNFFSPGT